MRFDHLRLQLVETVCAYDRLTKHDLAQVRLDYMVQAGCWGSRELIAHYEADRCRRRYLLAQECYAHRGHVDTSEIEARVADEFKPWDKRHAFILSVYDDFAHQAIASDLMEDGELAELEALYRTVLGRVHPALGNPDDEIRAKIFADARNAYGAYDLDAMRSVEKASRTWAKRHPELDTARLRAAVVVLEAQLEIEHTKLAGAKSAFPRALKRKIDDPSWLEGWREHFGGLIEQHERRGARYQEAYLKLCGC